MRQCHLVRVVLDALRAGRQAVDDDADDAVLDERCPGADADGRASGEQNLLKCQRAVVVVGKIGAGPRPTDGLEQLLAPVLAVVQYDVPWERLAQVFEQNRSFI